MRHGGGAAATFRGVGGAATSESPRAATTPSHNLSGFNGFSGFGSVAGADRREGAGGGGSAAGGAAQARGRQVVVKRKNTVAAAGARRGLPIEVTVVVGPEPADVAMDIDVDAQNPS